MLRFRISCNLRTLMLVVPLSAVSLVYFAPSAAKPPPSIDMFGTVAVSRDGTIEVRGGGVRIGGVGGTEVHANHLILKPDGTVAVFGSGSLILRK